MVIATRLYSEEYGVFYMKKGTVRYRLLEKMAGGVNLKILSLKVMN